MPTAALLCVHSDGTVCSWQGQIICSGRHKPGAALQCALRALPAPGSFPPGCPSAAMTSQPHGWSSELTVAPAPLPAAWGSAQNCGCCRLPCSQSSAGAAASRCSGSRCWPMCWQVGRPCCSKLPITGYALARTPVQARASRRQLHSSKPSWT